MDNTETITAQETAPDPGEYLKGAQKLRKRRIGMSFASYIATFSLVLLVWQQGMIPANVVGHYALFSVLANLLFWGLIHFNINLRFSDPSMTALQMTVCQWPGLWIMFFLESGQARAVFLLITLVPVLYGILALNVRRFTLVGLAFLGQYGLLILALWIYRPEVLVGNLELMQGLAFLLALAQIALIGGYISGLRDKLRVRNHELKDAMSRIQELVNIDELTGIYNRRRIFQVLSEESNRYQRAPGAFSLGILDVDFFKQVNDTHGHQCGDRILRELATSVVNDLRVIDSFGRYGGEEFLLVLPQTALSGAVIKAERIRKSIEALRFPDLPGNLRVTVSIGVAEFKQGETTDETLARADLALYQAKQNGRNQVVCAASNETSETQHEQQQRPQQT